MVWQTPAGADDPAQYCRTLLKCQGAGGALAQGAPALTAECQTGRANRLRQLLLHHRDSTATNSDLRRFGTDLYATVATHIVALADGKFLWR